MKSILFMVAAVMLSGIAHASSYKNSSDQIKISLCKEAVASYSDAMPSVKSCLLDTELEEDGYGYRISFLNCGSGEMIYVELIKKTSEILTASTGIDSDMCE